MMLIERVAALTQSPIFVDVPHYALLELAQIVSEEHYTAKETVIEQGRLESWMYLVGNGTLDISIDGSFVATLASGDTVGELAVIDPAPRSATAVAASDCLLLRIDQLPFNELLLEQPRVMQALLIHAVRLSRSNHTGFSGAVA